MSITKQIARHFRQLHFGKNWAASSLQENLADVTWQQAITQVHGLNTIATLVYHTHYYVPPVLKVLQGGPLIAKDALSFNHPPINSQQDWDIFLKKVWADAEAFATQLEQLPDDILFETFTDEKYDNYYRNLHGIIEHTHYHMGQIVLIKKILRTKNDDTFTGMS